MSSHPTDTPANIIARRKEFVWITQQITLFGLVRVLGAAVLFLILDRIGLSVEDLKKLTPLQRGLLSLIALLGGGWLIAVMFLHLPLGFALGTSFVIMFMLGWMISEISRL